MPFFLSIWSNLIIKTWSFLRLLTNRCLLYSFCKPFLSGYCFTSAWFSFFVCCSLFCFKLLLYLPGCEVPISIPILKITSLVGLILCGNSVARNIGEENSYVIKSERVIHCLLVYVAAKSPSIAFVFLITYFLILNSNFSGNVLSLGVLQFHPKVAWPRVTFIDSAWTSDIKSENFLVYYSFKF